MKAKRLYFTLIASLVILIAGFFGVAYAANKLMGGQADKLSKLRADSAALDALESSLSKNKRDILTYGELNAIAKAVVPQDKDQAQAVREIDKLAAESGIATLSSITFPVSTLGTVGPGTPQTNPDLTQLTPVAGIAGVYQLQITITQNTEDSVPYTQFMTFLSKLEQNRRTAQVTSITVIPDPKDLRYVSFTLVINEFIKP